MYHHIGGQSTMCTRAPWFAARSRRTYEKDTLTGSVLMLPLPAWNLLAFSIRTAMRRRLNCRLIGMYW